ncbi:MAG: hypothetical protein ABIH82_05895 [Candidatus Woesearchaeota archaeon]
MKEVVRREILFDLSKALEVLRTKDPGDIEQLKELSDHAIEDVATHKDLDLVTVTVLVYSLYKVVNTITGENYDKLLKELQNAKEFLQQFSFSRYNSAIRNMFRMIKGCDAKVKEHLDDVMQAAKVKKGTVLLEKGLSIGQAAGLMGLSNWDLQSYAGKSTAFEHHHEKVPAKRRVLTAFKIFGVS